MKKLTTLMAAGLAVLAYHTADAQVGLHLNLNLGGVAVHAAFNQPAPVAYSSYDNNDDYYYLPDVEAYYSVPQHCYYYNDGRQWVATAYLPGAYRNYDWRNARHYEIRGDRPFMHHDMYRTRYGGFDQRGGGYASQRFDNRGGFDQNRGGFDRPRNDDRGFGGQDRGNFDNRDRRFPDQNQNGFGGQNRGGFDQNRGQYQNGNDNQNRGGQFQNQNGNANQNRGGMDQNQNRGGQYQNGNAQPANSGGQFQNQNGNGNQNRGGGTAQQPSNGGGQNGGGSVDQQPANNNGQGGKQGQGRGRSGFGDNNHFAANEMGVVRPPRL